MPIIIYLLLGIALAALPIIMAIFPSVFGFDTNDPSWGAALPFLLYFTVPAGLMFFLLATGIYTLLRYLTVPGSSIISPIAAIVLVYVLSQVLVQ